MSENFDDENQPVVTKLDIKCPSCGYVNDVWLGFAILEKGQTDSQPSHRVWKCKQCHSDIRVDIKDKE